MKQTLLALFLACCSAIPARAVKNLANGTFNTTAPTGADIPNWTTGWGSGSVTGWDYVGTVNGPSGVYLGNNWVLTAAHVGAGAFTLAGTQYQMVPGSAHGFGGGLVDLTVFQIAQGPNLPALSIATAPPTPFSSSQAGSLVAMIGYGGGQKAWGLNTVTQNNLNVQPQNTSYVTADFVTAYGTTTRGSSSVTNNYGVIPGDSGGGGFIYSSSSWQLAGINEANDSNNNSYLVQLGSYAADINSVINNASSAPEPSAVALLGLGALALLGRIRPTPRGG